MKKKHRTAEHTSRHVITNQLIFPARSHGQKHIPLRTSKRQKVCYHRKTRNKQTSGTAFVPTTFNIPTIRGNSNPGPFIRGTRNREFGKA